MDIYSIYKATNVVNGKSYIGFTDNFDRRKSHHIRLANRNSQTAFHRALRKYGESKFMWEIIFQGKDKVNILSWAEPHFIKEYNTFADCGYGYNMTTGGECGAIMCEESKIKKSVSLSGQNHPQYGKKHTTEAIAKMKESHSGANNHKAKTFIFTSPENETFQVTGEFKSFCKQRNLSYKKMQTAIDSGKILRTNYTDRTVETSNCVGWSVTSHNQQ